MLIAAIHFLKQKPLNSKIFQKFSFSTSDTHTQSLKSPKQRPILHTTSDKVRFKLDDKSYNVKSYFIAKSVELKGLEARFHKKDIELASRDWLILSLEDNSEKSKGFATFSSFGSVVFLNCSDHIISKTIETAQPSLKNSLSKNGISEISSKDDYILRINSSLENYSSFIPNELVLKELDVNSVLIISSVLSQSVALLHYEAKINKFLTKYQEANQFKTRTKEFSNLIKESNAILYEVILNLGILDRTRLRDSAWKFDNYFNIWEGLREEFELQSRWESLQTKAEFLKESMVFVIDMIDMKKSHRLEWIIIVIIGLELLLGLYGIRGH